MNSDEGDEEAWNLEKLKMMDIANPIVIDYDAFGKPITAQRKMCFIFGCPSAYPKRNPSDSTRALFQVPNGADRSAWTRNIPNRFYPFDFSRHYLCDLHFEKRYIVTSSEYGALPVHRWWLRPIAIPTIFNKVEKTRNVRKAEPCTDGNGAEESGGLSSFLSGNLQHSHPGYYTTTTEGNDEEDYSYNEGYEEEDQSYLSPTAQGGNYFNGQSNNIVEDEDQGYNENGAVDWLSPSTSYGGCDRNIGGSSTSSSGYGTKNKETNLRWELGPGQQPKPLMEIPTWESSCRENSEQACISNRGPESWEMSSSGFSCNPYFDQEPKAKMSRPLTGSFGPRGPLQSSGLNSNDWAIPENLESIKVRIRNPIAVDTNRHMGSQKGILRNPGSSEKNNCAHSERYGQGKSSWEKLQLQHQNSTSDSVTWELTGQNSASFKPQDQMIDWEVPQRNTNSGPSVYVQNHNRIPQFASGNQFESASRPQHFMDRDYRDRNAFIPHPQTWKWMNPNGQKNWESQEFEGHGNRTQHFDNREDANRFPDRVSRYREDESEGYNQSQDRGLERYNERNNFPFGSYNEGDEEQNNWSQSERIPIYKFDQQRGKRRHDQEFGPSEGHQREFDLHHQQQQHNFPKQNKQMSFGNNTKKTDASSNKDQFRVKIANSNYRGGLGETTNDMGLGGIQVNKHIRFDKSLKEDKRKNYGKNLF